MSNCRQANGRVDILGPKPGDQFALYDKIPVHECTSYRSALTGTWCNTPLSTKYFSAENINFLQKAIQKVYIICLKANTELEIKIATHLRLL